MSFHKLVNTRHFSEAAIGFHRNGGAYTKAPRGSREYFEYWEIQEERCMNGYQVGDLWIPGRMYFWLNFFQVYQIPHNKMKEMQDEVKKYGHLIGAPVSDKEWDFPRFYEIHYDWWNYKYIAWNGGEFDGINCVGGKHICCAKARGAGWSYLEACDGVYNFTFIEGSKNFYFASREDYLIGDAILDKVAYNLDFINNHSPYWKQNRQKKDSPMHRRASYIDSQGVERGPKTEIMGIIVNDPNKTRGKRGKKITFEEAGSFKNLKAALEISLGSLRDGSSAIYVGQASVFGTGGEEGPSIEGLEDIHTNPDQWDMLSLPNWHEPGYEMTECGFFVPTTCVNPLFMDEDGNIDKVGAEKADDEERAKKMKSSDPKALDRRKAEYPRKPSEAFQRLNINGFNIAEVDAQIRRIETNRAIQSYIRYGDLIYGEKGVEFIPNPLARPILKYPHEIGDDLKGAVTIIEKPVRDSNERVPAGLYQIVVDPYYKDDAESTVSLFAVYVYKQYNDIDATNEGLPIAWWVGRPAQLDVAYDIMFKMARFYNCKIQSEISGGGQGIVDYAKHTKQLELLEFELEFMHNKEMALNPKNRSYFMNMNTDKKILGIKYAQDWHMKPRSVDENGQQVLTIHRIYDLGLLREMRKFNPDKGNFDRVSALIIAMFMLKENIHKQIKTSDDADGFFNRPLYGAGQFVETGLTTAY